MAIVTTTYAADAAITVTTWEGLATVKWATSAAFDNTSTQYVDVLVGGAIAGYTTTGVIAAGERFLIYVSACYDKDTVSYTGGIGTAFDAGDATLTQDTEFTPLNLKLLEIVSVEATAPDVDQAYNWGPVSIAAAFGGVVPQKFMLVLYNGTGASTKTSGMIVNAVGIQYTST